MNVTYAILASVSILGILARYPSSHELGVDSFQIHSLSNLISETGSIGWLINPFSYFGLAPLSYPPAVPISVASLTELSGLPVEAAVWVYSIMLGVAVGMNAFLLGRTAFRRDSVGWILAFLMSTTGGILSFTNWQLSTRGTFLTFLPLALTFMIRAMSSYPMHRGKDWHLFSIILFVMLFVHLMWLMLVPLVIIAWLYTRIAHTVGAILKHQMGGAKRRNAELATLVLIGMVSAGLIYWRLPATFSASSFPDLQGGPLPNLLVVRMGVYFATIMSVGILMVPIGLLRLLSMKDQVVRFALLSIVLTFLPVIVDPVYGALLGIPIILMMVAVSLLPPWRLGRRTLVTRANVSLLIGLVGLSVIAFAPAFVTVSRASAIKCGQDNALDFQTYNVALYVRYAEPQRDYSFAWDDPLNAARIEAISGRPALEPIAGIGVLGVPWLATNAHIRLVYPPDLVTSLLNQQQIYTVPEWMPGLSPQYDYFEGKHAWVLMNNPPDSYVDQKLLEFYHAKYAVQVCHGSDSVFFDDLNSSTYVVYSDSMQTVYKI